MVDWLSQKEGGRELVALLRGLCTVSHVMFARPLGVTAKLCSVIEAFLGPGHLVHYPSMD